MTEAVGSRAEPARAPRARRRWAGRTTNRLAAGAVTSLLIHAAAVLTYLTLHGLARATPQRHVDIEPVRVSLDHLPDPAMPSPGAAALRLEAQRPVKQRRRATALPPSQPRQPGVVATAGTVEQADAEPRQASQRPGVALLVQLDRARGSPIGARLAEMLMTMPEGRDLLAGTGLGVLEAFDVLLVATPDPPDPRATVLVARHRLQPAELRAAFDRAAAATNRVLNWRDDGRYPFGQRRAAVPRPGAGPDNRLFILPEPGVVVVTTPAYMRALFSTPGADGGTPEDDPWRALPRQGRADGEQPAPAGALVSVTVVGDRSASILGLAGSRALTVVAGTAAEPFVAVTAELTSDGDAMRAEGAWPELRDKLVATPLLQAADLVAAGTRARLTRDGHKLRVDVALTEAELLRLLQVVATYFGSTP